MAYEKGSSEAGIGAAVERAVRNGHLEEASPAKVAGWRALSALKRR